MAITTHQSPPDADLSRVSAQCAEPWPHGDAPEAVHCQDDADPHSRNSLGALVHYWTGVIPADPDGTPSYSGTFTWIDEDLNA